MNRLLFAAVASTVAGAAMAQTAPQPAPPVAPSPSMTAPAAPAPGNNAVNTPGANTSNQPVSGANSFTETQARSRIEGAGYSAVTALAKDAQGVWRGKATKDGKQIDVSLDFQGNVVAN